MQQQPKQVRYSETKIRSFLHLCQTKALTVADFCESHNISRATFYNWRNKYTPLAAKPRVKEKLPDFIPVGFHDQLSEPVLFAEIQLSSEVTVKIYQKVEASYFKALI
jgi:hypothetical protein